MQHVPMRNDTRPRTVPCVGFLIYDLDAACTVDMAMGVNHGVDRAVVPDSDSGKGLGCRVGFGRIDKEARSNETRIFVARFYQPKAAILLEIRGFS
jgi:hypothetical protein